VFCRWRHRPRTVYVLSIQRILGIVIGVVGFGLAHALITSGWLRATLTPDPMIRPWFTNSTGAVLVTAAIVGAGALMSALGAADRRGAFVRGVTVGVGAIAGMLAVMARIGPGNLGPIVFLIGGAILLAAGAAGGGIAAATKKS
jgi:hypothetical protein